MKAKAKAKTKKKVAAAVVAAPIPDAKSISELGRRLDRSHVAVRKWLADDRWPFARRGPWDAATIEKIRKWAAETLAANPAAGVSGMATGGVATTGDVAASAADGSFDPTSERQVKVRGMLERTKYTEAQRLKIEQNYLRRDEVERGRVERIHAVKAALVSLPDSGLVETMLSGAVQDAKDVLRGRLIEICNAFAAG